MDAKRIKLWVFAAMSYLFHLSPTQSQSIRNLEFLIGEWEVTETIYPGQPKEYQEKGIRSCSYYLDESFIKCESETTVSTSGKKRTYAYLINFDDKEKCFRATISYTDRDRLVWEGWASLFQEDKAWTPIFQDVATRK